ncbi:hypothetical protein SPRG_20604 [Saprolegnia parasitica CBS 223.65]|uniref:DUF4485 domain-containing protein n=1 Tax=Saprolegnia parasitica (strain CBS 223.65) TaxID=695850 RepID=A0A067C739_SAPPC|nr:hypothetical protein SPRG_20604 [Saprolegnia parasitica CBS 223.65]KDO26308.1 hypothetical protein SPRG_20604 [Saprolegnia parasitica CBS 223.65]|eukprot:XP_012203063.1 hypothetical protein SPRG_20604 [Saprolegnia parasitica CBS 223.65]
MHARVLKRRPPTPDASVALDDELVCLLMEIERIYLQHPRHLQIRIERWVDKISEPILNVQWKRSANDHALLLLEMTRSGVFRTPFDRNPPHGPLRTLPRYMIHARDSVTNKPLARDGKNCWSQAYERVVLRTSSPAELHAAPVTRSASYVEMTNQTLDALETSLESERTKCAALTAQVQELKVVTKTQADALSAVKHELQQAKSLHHREVERLQLLHTVEIDELKKRHHDQMQRAILANDRVLAAQRADACVAPRDHASNVDDFLCFIERFQHETSVLTQQTYTTPPSLGHAP